MNEKFSGILNQECLLPFCPECFLSSHLLSKRVNIKIYGTVILPVVLCVGTHVCMLKPMHVGVLVRVSH